MDDARLSSSVPWSKRCLFDQEGRRRRKNGAKRRYGTHARVDGRVGSATWVVEKYPPSSRSVQVQPIGPGQCLTLAHLCDHPWGRGRRGRRRRRPIVRLLTRRREVQRPLAQRLALLFLLGHVPVLVADFHHARGVGDGWSSNLLRPRRTLGALTVVCSRLLTTCRRRSN